MRQLGTISTAEALEQDLERRILQGDFATGKHLREVELSEEYGVGRHTLRAAFDRLVRRGLLVKQRNRGVSVRQLTAADLREIYEVREAIECEAFRILAGRKIVPDSARERIDELRKMTSKTPRADVVAADLGFHRALVEATGNTRLVRVHQDLGAEIQLWQAQLTRGYMSPRQTAGQHAELLELIADGNLRKAEGAIRDHLEGALDWLVANAGGE